MRFSKIIFIFLKVHWRFSGLYYAPPFMYISQVWYIRLLYPCVAQEREIKCQHSPVSRIEDEAQMGRLFIYRFYGGLWRINGIWEVAKNRETKHHV